MIAFLALDRVLPRMFPLAEAGGSSPIRFNEGEFAPP
jgi:hypothetical protein